MFTGVGGFELGIERATNLRPVQQDDSQGPRKCDNPANEPSGWECVGYSEIDKFCNQVMRYRFQKIKNYGDAKTIVPDELPDFDLLCGGFPCQAFSIAGNRKGFSDTRGTLFSDIVRILRVKRPRFVLLENVKGLLNHDEGNTFGTIILSFWELGYDIQWMVLNSKFFGVPQNRERVFIIGSLRGEPRPEILPFGETTEKVIEINKEARQAVRKYGKNGIVPPLQNWSPLLNGNQIRKLTPIECERLQGFPDNWTIGSDTQRYKQCGNAVTTNVIAAIAEKLLW